MSPTVPRGRFVWHELLTTDPDAAIPFYTRLIGWRVVRFEQDPSYRIFTLKGTPISGLMKLPEDAQEGGAPPNWLSYVGVPDVDATVRQAVGLGARTFVEGMDIATVGRIAVLADPQGAAFAVYTPARPGPTGDDAPAGDFSWHEYYAVDWKSAWEFYRALFGWEKDSEMDMGPMGTYWMFRRAGGTRALGGFFNKPPNVPVACWLPYVKVPSADKAAERASAARGKVVMGPMDVPDGSRIAQIVDPQGAMFAVHAEKAKKGRKGRKGKKGKKGKTARKRPAPKKRAAKKKRPAAKKRPATRKRAVKKRK